MSAGIAGVLDFSMPLDYFQICTSPKKYWSSTFCAFASPLSFKYRFNTLEN